MNNWEPGIKSLCTAHDDHNECALSGVIRFISFSVVCMHAIVFCCWSLCSPADDWVQLDSFLDWYFLMIQYVFKTILSFKKSNQWLTIKDWLITKMIKNRSAHVTQTHLLLCAEIEQAFGGSSGLPVGRLNTLCICVRRTVFVCVWFNFGESF